MMASSITLPRRTEPDVVEQPRSLVVGAYQRLRIDIVSGRLTPGSRLRVEHLKDNYQVGAGTLREALGLLVADALVVPLDQRGFRVAPISLDDFRDVTENRILLEGEALRQSIENGSEAWEGELHSAFHRLGRAERRLRELQHEDTFDAYEECNARFHDVLLANCRSHWLLHFLAILGRQAERYRRLVLTRRAADRDVHAEHQAIFDAALEGDAPRAAAAAAKHIRITYRAICDMARRGEADLA